MIAIIDYGAGNLGSVTNAIDKLGFNSEVTKKPEDALNAEAVILPGVGAAGDTMNKLTSLGMAKAICQRISENRPLLAICIGLQIMLSKTEEGGGHRCLNVIPGAVRRLPIGLKVPHMGWNQVKQQFSHPIFAGIPDNTNFYFVHSYYATPDDKSVIAGTTDYGSLICSLIIKDNLIATQFHPEKSGNYGLRIYSNFLSIALGDNKNDRKK